VGFLLVLPISVFGASLNAIWIKWELTTAFGRLYVVLLILARADCDIELAVSGEGVVEQSTLPRSIALTTRAEYRIAKK
jgi:hypothetical protein